MEARATTKYIRLSPYKTRRVINIVRGKRVDEALAILQYMPHKAAREVARTIKSAAANAEHNFDMEINDLVVKTIFADEGPRLKRYMPRARGRIDSIQKPTTHITVIVDDGEDF
ncbi:MAG: 50S ribosomal protein L22 [Chloroflexaceae bacterium]|nr:50S ribosomal protein L22 [Chloroflexaceae bacterium]